MTAAVRALIPFCFDALRLHRVEAACIPANQASIRLLEKTGFPARAMPANISASTASGRTICSTPGCKTAEIAGGQSLPWGCHAWLAIKLNIVRARNGSKKRE